RRATRRGASAARRPARAPLLRPTAPGRARGRRRQACRCEEWSDGSDARDPPEKPGAQPNEVMELSAFLIGRALMNAQSGYSLHLDRQGPSPGILTTGPWQQGDRAIAKPKLLSFYA